MSSENARVAGSVSPPFSYGAGTACHWMSGAGSPESVRLKPPDSATFVVIGPECISCHRARFLGPGLLPERAGLRGVPHRGDHRVVARVRPATGAVHQGQDAVLAQMISQADAGQHEQLRAADHAGGQDDLALCLGGLGHPRAAGSSRPIPRAEPDMAMPVTRASVCTVRLGRSAAGCR